MMHELREMLGYCRPSGSKTEAAFVRRFIDDRFDAAKDSVGNRYVMVREEDGSEPRVMWSCHYDTVHNVPGMQKVRKNGRGEFVARSKHSNCLGADDTAGVWVASQLIEAEIPGQYIFHFGEEVGCIGAKHIADADPLGVLENIDISIALDRRAKSSVVTHQMMGRCASNDFAIELCKQLGMGHVPDDGGIWTDNVEYMGHVAEIVNLSVGYYGAHSSSESLCGEYLRDLVCALIEVDYSALPVVRAPSEGERGGWGTHNWGDSYQGIHGGGGGYVTQYPGSNGGDPEAMRTLAAAHPDVIAKMLWEYGFDEDDILEEIFKVNGTVDLTPYITRLADEDEQWEDQEGYAG